MKTKSALLIVALSLIAFFVIAATYPTTYVNVQSPALSGAITTAPNSRVTLFPYPVNIPDGMNVTGRVVLASNILTTAAGAAGNPAFGYTNGGGIYFNGSNTVISAGALAAIQATNSAGNARIGIGKAPDASYALDVNGLGRFVTTLTVSATTIGLQNATGEIPAGQSILGGNTITLSPSVTTAGKQSVVAVYNGTGYVSVFESANVASGNPDVLLVRSGGGVAIATNAAHASLTVAGGTKTNILALAATAGGSSILYLSTNGIFLVVHGVYSSSSNQLALSSIAVGASPFSWTNTTTKNVFAFVGGGTVTDIAINGTATAMTQGPAPLQPGEWTTVTYAVAPTMTWKPF